METTRRALFALMALTIALLASEASAGDLKWKKHDINPESPFEAAGAFDVDNDGILDIVCGEWWYKGPDFQQKSKVRDVEQAGTYRNCFATLPVDVNADGHMDFFTCSYFGRNVGWVENPGKAGEPWTYHEIDLPGTSEAAWMVDLTGNGQLDFLPNPTNQVVFYELVRGGTAPVWKKYDFGAEAACHGVGTGDINGDGRLDLLTPKGWFEAPESLPKSGTTVSTPGGSVSIGVEAEQELLTESNPGWTWHPEWTLGGTGIQILARDFDGDGLTDVVWGMGHQYGLYWMRQEQGPDGQRTWADPIEIDPKAHQVHTLLWADLNGDGKAEELVTGTRVYGHEVEPGDTDAPEIAYYTFDRDAGAWNKHLIYQGEPATNAPPVERRQERDAQKDFPKGTAGTGLQMMAIDLNGNGRLDLLCPGKSGLYWFENLGGEN
ncbi:hypothetical protein BH23PLA1_BH23PLA1_33140 [soil metagenome]